MNNWNAIGRLTNDPELRYTPSGVAVATFTIAIDRDFTDKNGERQADFINCVVWRQLAELCSNYLNRGSEIGVTASMQSRSYENKEGRKVYLTEAILEKVKFLRKPGANGQPGAKVDKDPFADAKNIDIPNEDLPF